MPAIQTSEITTHYGQRGDGPRFVFVHDALEERANELQ